MRESTGLAGHLEGWAPAPVRRTGVVTGWAVEAFCALLDQPSPLVDGTGALPPLWTGFGLLAHPAQAELGADGHPTEGEFLPPIPHRRRMFAGGRWFAGPDALPVGEPIDRRSAVTSVEVKQGRSGEMAFVTVRTEFGHGGRVLATEEQDIVYRSEPAPETAKPAARPGAVPEEVPEAEHELVLEPDPTLLFRFSALTYNAHRIHYDQPYTTGVEGYPGLVVHGPLLALLALELPRRHHPDERVAEFRYRLRRPAFAGAPVRACCTGPDQDGVRRLEVGAVGAPASLTATVRLGGG